MFSAIYKKTISICAGLLFVTILFQPIFVIAQVMTSTTYRVQSDSVNFGGGLGLSSNYKTESTFGEVATGFSESTNYRVSAGFLQSVDTTNPSVPTALTATAVSSSAINLSWTASTDNVSVLAYRIYRDSNIVATSSSTSYSDTGLTASTLYSYTVSAIDTSLNESARSATSSATILAVTTTTTTTETGGGGGGRILEEPQPQFLNFLIEPDVFGARIDWLTDKFSIVDISWGETLNYEIDSIQTSVYEKKHNAVIKNLKPNTLYNFKIVLTDIFGVQSVLYSQITTLKTEEVEVVIPESSTLSVTGFIAKGQTDGINLSWNKPQGPVTIVRSDTFYPESIADGTTIYIGEDNSFIDVLGVPGKTYYYSIFVKDEYGEYGSPAITSIKIPLPGEGFEPIKPPLEEITYRGEVHPVLARLQLSDFDFIQHGKKISFVGSRISIDPNANLTVSLPYSKTPEILKTIAVTVRDAYNPDAVFTFLLKINKEKTAYIATIGALETSGLYDFTVDILDYENQGLRKLAGAFSVFAFTEQKNFLENVGIKLMEKKALLGVLLFILLALLAFLVRKKRNSYNLS